MVVAPEGFVKLRFDHYPRGAGRGFEKTRANKSSASISPYRSAIRSIFALGCDCKERQGSAINKKPRNYGAFEGGCFMERREMMSLG